MVLLTKAANSLMPLILKEVVDSITCNPKEMAKEGKTCDTREHTYVLIIIYSVIKFTRDFLDYVREVPFTCMIAKAEISIADEVYDHV